MKTSVEVTADEDGTVTELRVYHRAGNTPQGPDTRYAWTHPMKEKKTCEACTAGTIPPDVKKGAPK